LAKEQIASKIFSSVFLATVLLLTAGAAYSGQSDSALQSNGLLTFETGSTDRFAHYREEKTALGTVILVLNEQQPVFDESKNKCELDQSDEGPLMLLEVDDGSVNPGFVGDSMGVFSRGGGGNARGVKCGRVNNSEQLIFNVQSFDTDNDGDSDGSAVIRSKIDVEFKQSAIAIFTTEFGGQQTGQFWIGSGDNQNNPPADFPDAIQLELEACDSLTGTDSNNDSGPNDNCPVEFDALWTSMTVETRGGGQISIEGGGDYSDPLANRSEFELVRVDGILNCQEGFVGGDSDAEGSVVGARLNNVETDCEALVPFSVDFNGNNVQLLFETNGQDTTWVINTEWQAELQLVEAEQEPTLVSWAEEDPDWATCTVDPDGPGPLGPTCFELDDCDVGEPVRFCSETFDPENPELGVSCAIDEDCGAAEGSCELTDIVAPAEEGFPDMDTVREGNQYSCICEQTETWLGTSGRDGVTEVNGYPDGDDTQEDHTLVQQCIFLEGDIRWNR